MRIHRLPWIAVDDGSCPHELHLLVAPEQLPGAVGAIKGTLKAQHRLRLRPGQNGLELITLSAPPFSPGELHRIYREFESAFWSMERTLGRGRITLGEANSSDGPVCSN